MNGRRRSTIVMGVAAALVLTVVVVSTFWLRASLQKNFNEQYAIRIAQLSRSRVFRAQLNEETGMRGFVATRLPEFLQPYGEGREAFPAGIRQLRSALAEVGTSTASATEEEAINARWLREVAEPAIRGPLSVTQQRRGKVLVDQLRRVDSALFKTLNDLATSNDRAAARLLDAIVFFVLPVVLLIGGSLLYAAARMRLLEDRMRDRQRAYENEKHIADVLQEAFVQRTLPQSTGGALHGVYVPAGLEARVGGDWYDALALPDKTILFSLGDVAGHGIGSAVTMTRVRQAIVSIGTHERNPAAILERANALLLLQDGAMVTAVCGFIDLATGEIRYSTAGHPPMRLAHAGGEVETLPYAGPPLGAIADPAFTTQTARAEPGSLLVAYTDGLVERTRNWIEGEAALTAAIAAVHAEKAGDAATAIMQRIFSGEAPADDVAILTISFREDRQSSAPIAADVAVAARHPVSPTGGESVAS